MSPRALVIAPLVLLAFVSSSAARTWHILPDGTGDAPTVQAGIDSAAVGDAVELAPGTFTEPTIAMKSGVILRGAGANLTTLDGEGSRRILTVIGCDSSTQVEHLRFLEGISLSPLDSIPRGGGILLLGSDATVANCDFYSCVADRGGGIAVGDGSPTIRDCLFSACSAMDRGGAVMLYSVDDVDLRPVLDTCQFEGNASIRGGAVSTDSELYHGSSAVIQIVNCVFLKNTATYRGGAVHNFIPWYSSPDHRLVTSDSRFEGNEAVMGGAVWADQSDIEIHRCNFSSNHATSGGALALESSAELAPVVTDSEFYENTAGECGGAIVGGSSLNSEFPTAIRSVFVSNSAPLGGAICAGSLWISGCTLHGNDASEGSAIHANTLRVTNSILTGNRGSASVSCSSTLMPDVECTTLHDNTGGGFVGCLASLEGTGGNQDIDPFLCDPGNGDFTLRSSSPCAPANSNGCGLIGALGVGCGPVAVEATSWGRIRGAYR